MDENTSLLPAIIGFGALAAILGVIFTLRGRRRTQGYGSAAARLGLTFQASATTLQQIGFGDARAPDWAEWRPDRIDHVLHGQLAGVPIACFTAQRHVGYRVDVPGQASPSQSRTDVGTYVVARTGAALPTVWVSRFARRPHGLGEFRTGWEQFDAAYKVGSDDPVAAAEILTIELQQWLLTVTGRGVMSLWVGGPWAGGDASPGQPIDPSPAILAVRDLVSRVPPTVWERYRAQ